MNRASRIAVAAVVVSLVLAGVLLFLLLGGPPERQAPGDLPAQDAATRDHERAAELAAGPAGAGVTPSAPDSSEAPPPAEEDLGDPMLLGVVFGQSGPLAGATVTAYPFAIVKELIAKYERLSIAGLGDIPALIRQVKGDILALRSRGTAAKTDDAGRYAFYRLVPGEYAFLVLGPAHVFRAGDTTLVVKGEARRLDFHLQAGQVIAGKVVDPAGTPIGGASVLAVYQVKGLAGVAKLVRKLLALVNGQFLSGPFEAKSGADGRFRLDTLPAGIYELEARHPGFAVSLFSDVVTGTSEIVIQLGPGGEVRGRLATDAGAPLPSLPVTMVASDNKIQIPLPIAGVSDAIDAFRRLIGEDDPVARSSDDGTFAFKRLRPGAYELLVETSGLLPFRRQLSVRDGEVVDLGDLAIGSGSSIRGTVITREKEPVAGAVVSAQIDSREPLQLMVGIASHLSGRIRTQTDAKGEFVLSGLHRGQSSYRVIAFDRERGMGIVPGAIPDGEPVQVILGAPWRVAGTVVHARGKSPIARADVTGGGCEVRTDDRGRFLLEPALPDAGQTLFGGGEPRLHLCVAAEGLETHHRFLSEEEAKAEIVVELGEEATLEGIVKTPDGEPRPAALVRVVPARLPPIGGFDMITLAVTFSDTEGKFRFGSLRHGMEFRVEAASPGYASAATEPLTTRPGEELPFVELQLGLGGRIVGLVTDGRDPLPGIKLRLYQEGKGRESRAGFFFQMLGIPEAGKVTYTNHEGKFSYDDVTPGAYALTATTGSGISKSVTVDVPPEGVAEVTIEIDVGGSISGFVVDGAGAPLPFATVRLLEAGNQSRLGLQRALGGALASQTSDQTGAFLFKQVKEGRYSLIGQRDGYAPREVGGVAIDQPPYTIVLELQGSIAGEVTIEGTGDPVTVFRTRIDRRLKEGRWDSPLKSWRTAETLDGLFRYDGLEAGDYEIEVQAEDVDAAPAVVAVAVESGKESFVTVVLKQPGTIAGIVLAEEKPVAGAQVSIVASEDDSQAGSAADAFGNLMEQRMRATSATTGTDGRFVMKKVPPGTHTVEASHRDYPPGRAQAAVEAGAETQVTIALRAGFDLSGILRNHEGNPESQRMLLVQGSQGSVKSVQSQGDGTWSFSGLKAGKYRLWCPTPDLSRELAPIELDLAEDTSGLEIVLPPPPDREPTGLELPEGIPDEVRERLKQGKGNEGGGPKAPTG